MFFCGILEHNFFAWVKEIHKLRFDQQQQVQTLNSYYPNIETIEIWITIGGQPIMVG